MAPSLPRRGTVVKVIPRAIWCPRNDWVGRFVTHKVKPVWETRVRDTNWWANRFSTDRRDTRFDEKRCNVRHGSRLHTRAWTSRYGWQFWPGTSANLYKRGQL